MKAGDRVLYHGSQGAIVQADEFEEYLVRFDHQDEDEEPIAVRESELEPASAGQGE